MKTILVKIVIVIIGGSIFFSCEKEVDLFEPEIIINFLDMYEVVNDTISISISVSSDQRIDKVELWVNGLNTEQYDDTKPYSIDFITEAYQDGIISLFIRAYRKDGDYYDSDPIIIEIDNHPNFTNFTMANSPLSYRGVGYLDVTEDGTVWVSDYEAIYKIVDDIWDKIIIPDSIMSNSWVGMVAHNDDTLWVTLGNFPRSSKLLKIYQDSLIAYDIESLYISTIEEMIFDKINRLWMTGHYGELVLFENQTFKIWGESDHWSDSTHMFYSDDGAMGGFAIDEDNTIWIAGYSRSEGLILTHYANNEWDVINIPDFGGWIEGLVIDIDGNKWISSRGKGIAKMTSDLSWTIYDTTNSGLLTNIIFDLYLDNDGILWTGSWDSGVISFDPIREIWNSYNPHNSEQFFLNINIVDGYGSTIWCGANYLYSGASRGLVKIVIP